MKVRACILIVIWSSLLIEPITANLNINSPYSSCSKQQEIKPSCSKSRCDKPVEDEENDCENERCNPLMSCPTGNFYLFGQSHISLSAFILSKQKLDLVNDNRVMKHLSECWHPPEII